MNNVFYVIDTETTGTDHELHDIIEISLWRSSDGDQKSWCIKAENPETIEDKALYVNKHKREDILHQTKFGKETYLKQDVVVNELESWVMDDDSSVEDRIFVAQNPSFDFPFVANLWRRTGNKNSFPFGQIDAPMASQNILDIMQLVRFIDILTGKSRRNYNLGKLVKAFGVTKAQSHRADGDVKMTKDVLLKIIEGFKDSADNFKDFYID